MVNAALRARQNLPKAARIDHGRAPARSRNTFISRYLGIGTRLALSSPSPACALGDARDQRRRGAEVMWFARTGIAVLAAVLAISPVIAPRDGHAASRIKDLTSVEGVRQNQLIGYG